ncbi:flavodoxin domain-containing protein [Ruminococcus sp.]|uniref:flavodoxin domain-containing protein n=1 Tax=Ruminococcus sp. TaxID=41978 RepID=UPI0025EC323A|nr:flavodoxin domain-containing protein [Ruminococcus sp.]
MKTAIVYYSKHHGNTKKLIDAIAAADSSVSIIDVTNKPETELSSYDRIGFASGIYFSSFAKQIISFAEKHLPENKDVFYIYTHGAPIGGFLKGIRAVAKKKHCRELGRYHCFGFDTYGPFKIFGGIAKGHPNEKEISAVVRFYKGLNE